MPGSGTTSMPGKESSKYSWPFLAHTEVSLHHLPLHVLTHSWLQAQTLGQHK